MIEAGSASLSWMCNLSNIPSSSHLFVVLHLHRSALIFLFKLVSLVITSRATRRSAVLFECENASALIWSIFSLHVVTKRKKGKKKKKTRPFCTYACKLFQILEPFSGWGRGGREDRWRKALHFRFFIGWTGCLQGFSCNIYKCCLHHWTTTRKIIME